MGGLWEIGVARQETIPNDTHVASLAVASVARFHAGHHVRESVDVPGKVRWQAAEFGEGRLRHRRHTLTELHDIRRHLYRGVHRSYRACFGNVFRDV